ncbi:uncharacterized protein MELLADRAFT_90813 [Melampsora larici-populina 98AG31]|uniref:Uncharacterized protein n=1 Tax=Melampsora larici-populina (strain 98AG31 / pathotype 3-4-7) TaxID=747676 RepID=F4R7L5_MELLP|nr:uncharacterized protein MELLADRAFT_90813 [Melampsora larici-populina 98AG31]EGG11764.1 hypothetical protein MELLADRAFT_90813 [Melampsora larici-populina 98AG31]
MCNFVMVAPWDPNFHYRFTLACAFIWAQSIERSEATKHMAPNTSEYRTEIAKTRILHPGLKLKDRLKLRFPSPMKRKPLANVSAAKKRPFDHSPTRQRGQGGVFGSQKGSPSSHRIGLNKFKSEDKMINLVSSSPNQEVKPLRFQPRERKQGSPRKAHGPKKAKLEPVFINVRGPKLFNYSDAVMSSANTDELELLQEHEHLLDQFVKECGVTKDFNRIRNVLINSGIKSWIDLVPSVKMTEAVLIEHGVPREVSTRMLQKAEERNVTENQKNVELAK